MGTFFSQDPSCHNRNVRAFIQRMVFLTQHTVDQHSYSIDCASSITRVSSVEKTVWLIHLMSNIYLHTCGHTWLRQVVHTCSDLRLHVLHKLWSVSNVCIPNGHLKRMISHTIFTCAWVYRRLANEHKVQRLFIYSFEAYIIPSCRTMGWKECNSKFHDRSHWKRH